MTLAEVREWIKTFDIADNYYIGKLDNKKQRSIGIYQGQNYGTPIQAIGQDSSYDIKYISVLLHWNKNANETEIAAKQLWECLRNVTNLDVGNNHIDYLRLNVPEPIGVGTDDDGVYEYVIEFELYYRRV